MLKRHILITLAFDDKTSECRNIDTELAIQRDIARILQKYHNEKHISHFVIADDEVISEKIKNT
jgi:hypothetical protein